MNSAPQQSNQTSIGRWRRRIWNAAGASLAAGMVWLVFRAANWRAVVAEVRTANIWVLVFSWLFVGGSSWLLRAARWRLLLTAEKNLGFWPVFWANSAGNLGNNVLPARAGEFIRAAMVGATSGLKRRFILATAACERVLDLLVFVTLAEIAVWYASGIPAAILHAINVAFVIALAAVVILISTSRSGGFIHFLIARGLRRPQTAERVRKYIEPVLAGIRTIHSARRLIGFLGLSVCVWLMDALGAKLVAYAMGFHLAFSAVFVLIAGLVLISLVPGPPGQIGVYQWVVTRVLATLGIGFNQALAYSLVLQASGYIVLALLGTPGLLIFKKLRQDSRKLTLKTIKAMETSPQWAQHR